MALLVEVAAMGSLSVRVQRRRCELRGPQDPLRFRQRPVLSPRREFGGRRPVEVVARECLLDAMGDGECRFGECVVTDTDCVAELAGMLHRKGRKALPVEQLSR